MNVKPFDYTGVIARFFLCGFVVFAVYNPGRYSWYHWVTAWDGGYWELKALTGVGLMAVLYIIARATYQTIGVVGIITLVIVNALGIWALHKSGLLGASDSMITTVTILVSITIVLTIGVSYGHIYHRVTGVLHSENVH